MNLLVLEDDPAAISVISYLNQRGYNVWHAHSLLDVAYFLEEEPGLDAFDKLIFDVAVPIEEFSFMGNRVINYGQKYGFSGFEFVSENFELLSSKKIALITAYKSTLYQYVHDDNPDAKILKKIITLDKTSDDFMMQLFSFLNG